MIDEKILNEKTYDSVFWTSVVKLTRYFVPLVNEAFGEHFTENATVTLKPMKQAIEQPDKSFDNRKMDALAGLSEMFDELVEHDYHFECETWGDKNFAIRIAEYAAGAAYDSIKLTDKGAKMVIPYSVVIFLRAADDIADSMEIEIEYPGGVASYEAPVLKIKNYSVEELFEKRLLLLLPFYGFTFENEFREMEKDEAKMDRLRSSLLEINRKLSELVDCGELVESQKNHLIDWIKRVLEKLTVGYENVSKGVEEIMGGFILHTRTDDILDQGREQGLEQGLEQGRTQGRINEYIEIRREDGYSDDQIIDGLMQRFSLDHKSAESQLLSVVGAIA